MYDRKLLSKLSKCGWNIIRAYHKSATLDDNATPGASIAVHTYGDFLNFNPHIHAIVPDGYFLEDGNFQIAPRFRAKNLTEAFRHEVLSMFKKEGKITDVVIDNMMSWHHSGFHVHIGERIWPEDEQGLENLARYIITQIPAKIPFPRVTITENQALPINLRSPLASPPYPFHVSNNYNMLR